ncbi:hypothetical protein GCM10027425_23350 [Alteromonas gracilis]
MAGESARHMARRHAHRDPRRSMAFAHGAEGEERTAQTLAALGAGWTVWHDLHWPGRSRANIDHLVIGPGGVFVVDSKHWSGTVTVIADRVRQNGRVRETEVAAVGEASLAVARLVPAYADSVLGVLCLVREEPVRGRSRDVLMCSTATLVEMLESRPARLTAYDIERIVTTLQRTMRTYAVIAPPPPASETRRVHLVLVIVVLLITLILLG